MRPISARIFKIAWLVLGAGLPHDPRIIGKPKILNSEGPRRTPIISWIPADGRSNLFERKDDTLAKTRITTKMMIH